MSLLFQNFSGLIFMAFFMEGTVFTGFTRGTAFLFSFPETKITVQYINHSYSDNNIYDDILHPVLQNKHPT